MAKNHGIERIVKEEDVFITTQRVPGHVSFTHFDWCQRADSAAKDVDILPCLLAERTRELDADDTPEGVGVWMIRRHEDESPEGVVRELPKRTTLDA